MIRESPSLQQNEVLRQARQMRLQEPRGNFFIIIIVVDMKKAKNT